MEKELVVEIIAVLVGVVVIVIETIIIFILLHHIRIMKRSFEEIRLFMHEFRRGIDKHLEHMDIHSHKIEEVVENIQTEVCGLPSDKK